MTFPAIDCDHCGFANRSPIDCPPEERAGREGEVAKVGCGGCGEWFDFRLSEVYEAETPDP